MKNDPNLKIAQIQKWHKFKIDQKTKKNIKAKIQKKTKGTNKQWQKNKIQKIEWKKTK